MSYRNLLIGLAVGSAPYGVMLADWWVHTRHRTEWRVAADDRITAYSFPFWWMH